MTPTQQNAFYSLAKGRYNCLMYALSDTEGKLRSDSIFSEYFLSSHDAASSFENTYYAIFHKKCYKVKRMEDADIAIAWWLDEYVDPKDDAYVCKEWQYHVIKRQGNNWFQKEGGYRACEPSKLSNQQIAVWANNTDPTLNIAFYKCD